jgi:hypothetical protein
MVFTIVSLVVTILALIAAVVFYRKSAKAFKTATRVFAGYLEGTLKRSGHHV